VARGAVAYCGLCVGRSGRQGLWRPVSRGLVPVGASKCKQEIGGAKCKGGAREEVLDGGQDVGGCWWLWSWWSWAL
jgi:hypothetical protein